MCKLLKWRKESCDSSYCDAFWSLWWECTKKWWECCCTCWKGKIAFLFRKNNIKAGSWASLLERELFGSVPILLRKKWQLAVLSLAEDTAWWSAFLFLEYYGRWCLVSVSKLFMNLVLSIAIDQTQLKMVGFSDETHWLLILCKHRIWQHCSYHSEECSLQCLFLTIWCFLLFNCVLVMV